MQFKMRREKYILWKQFECFILTVEKEKRSKDIFLATSAERVCHFQNKFFSSRYKKKRKEREKERERERKEERKKERKEERKKEREK